MPSVSAPESRFPETANLSRCEDNKIIPNITHTCINVHINGTFNLLCRIVFRGARQCFCRTCMADGTEMAGEPGRDGLERAGRKTYSRSHTSVIRYLSSATCYGPSASTGFHPIASRYFYKSLTINKLPKPTLRLGASKSTQRQPHFCKSLTISSPRKEGWLWGGKFAGKLFFGHENGNAVKIGEQNQIFLPPLPRRQDLCRDVVSLATKNKSLERVVFS